MKNLSQIIFSSNPYAGVLILIALFIYSLPLGFAAIISLLAVYTYTFLTKENNNEGLLGYNSILVGIALATFFELSFLSCFYIYFAAFITIPATQFIKYLLQKYNLPLLTMPFVAITLLFILSASRFARLITTNNLPMASLPKTNNLVEGVVTLSTFFHGTLHGFSQIILTENLYSGILIILAFFITKKEQSALAIVASFIGVLISWPLGASEAVIRSGAYGFNAILTAVALSLINENIFIILIASILSTILFASLGAFFEALGLPSLTLSFILTTWIFYGRFLLRSNKH